MNDRSSGCQGTQVLLSTFETDWRSLQRAAATCEEAGVGGLWVMDHFTGAVHDRSHVLECWSVLAGLAVATESCGIGSLVTNASVRRPVVLAQTAATVQQLAAGRLTLGIGAGGGALASPYAAEVVAAGGTNGSAAERRAQLRHTIDTVRDTWATSGFLTPAPAPPIIVGGYGPQVAGLAGTMADGFNTSADNPDLAEAVEAAVAAHRGSQRAHLPFEVSAFSHATENWIDPSSDARQWLRDAGVDSVILIVAPPFDDGLLREIATYEAND